MSIEIINMTEIEKRARKYWRDQLSEEINYVNREMEKAASQGEYGCSICFPSYSYYVYLVDIIKEAGYDVSMSILDNSSKVLQVFEPIGKPFEERKMMYSQNEVIEVVISWETNV